MSKIIKKISCVIMSVITMMSCINVEAKGKPIKKKLENGIYVIQSMTNSAGKVLDISGADKENGSEAIIWDYNQGLNQAFYFDYNESDGYYTIVALHSMKCIGVENLDDGQSTQVKQYNASFRDNFKWKLIDVGSGKYQFELKSCKLRLDVCGGAGDNGTKLQLWESNDTNAQKFKLFKSNAPAKEIEKIHSFVQQKRAMSTWTEVNVNPSDNKVTKEMLSPCEKLKKVAICKNVKEIEEGTFSNCKEIDTVICDPKWLSKFDKSKLNAIVIPDGIKHISKDAFKGCSNLKIVKIPESVTSKIDATMFENFKDLQIYAPQKLKNEISNDIGKTINNSFVDNDFTRALKAGSDLGNKIDTSNEFTKTLREVRKQRYIKSFLESKINGTALSVTQKNEEENLNLEKLKAELKTLDSEIAELMDKYISLSSKNEQVKPIEQDIKNVDKPSITAETTMPTENENPEESEYTTIDDLVRFDNTNARYKRYAKAILKNIDSKDFKYSESSDNTLENISMRISDICRKIKEKYGISPYPVQVMTILRLADDVLNDSGSIAQVKTGEGKSFVIAILATVLAEFGRTIDIVTSTSELARRDYENQKKYYDLFGISSDVLKRGSKDNDSLRSDLGEQFNVESLDKQIVYSTNSTYEFVFLHGIFSSKPLRQRPYDVVIVDEIDNMLLDQGTSPAIIASPIKIKNAEEVYKKVYENRNKTLEEIINVVKDLIPGDENSINTISKLQEAAKISDRYESGKDYVIQDGEIMIIDHSTGYIKPGSRWKNFIHEMVEIKHGIPMKPSSVSTSLISQNSFFNMYKHITGLTGTLGSDTDRELLTKAYKTKLFYMPRHAESKQKVEYHNVYGGLNEVFGEVKKEVNQMQNQGRPVIVIMPTNNIADYFCERFFPKANKITGIDLEGDRKSISEAGKSGQVTIATNAAGRGIDIILDEKAKKQGGLHVIVPFLPMNQRILGQAIGRSARQGQPGTASIYITPNSKFYTTPQFNECYDKLLEIEMRFSKYAKEQWSWMFDHEQKYNMLKGEFPLGVTAEEALKLMSQELSGAIPTLNTYCRKDIIENVLKDSMKSMVMLAWGIFFSEMCDEADRFTDSESIEIEYNNFIEELHDYFPKDCNTFEKTLSNFTATSGLSVIEQLSGKIMECVGLIMDSAIPDPIKEILKNKVVSGTMNITTGVGQIIAGAEMCTTVVGTVGGIPMIVNGSNMAIMGVQDIWNVIHGKDEESVNLIKEALGHKYDNTVDLMELAITMGSAKKVSKVGQKAVSEAKNSLGKAFGKARKYASATGSEIREVSKSARSLCRKQIAKFRGPKYAVSGVPVNAEMLAEEFAKENMSFRKILKPNLQTFAEKGINSKIANPYDLTPTHSITKGHAKMQKFIDEISKNGIKEPIKYVEYNGEKYIVDGHHRIAAAKKLGIKEIPIEQVQLPFAGYKTIDDLMWFN